MKNITVLLVLLISFQVAAISQSRFQLSLSGGPTFTSEFGYNNCTRSYKHSNDRFTSNYIPTSFYIWN
jgi:hypothetical protein